MGRVRSKLPDGTQFEFDAAGEVPTRQEYDHAVRELEFQMSRSPGVGTATGTAVMQPIDERQALESEIRKSDEILRASREARAETISNRYSFVGALAGGIPGAKVGAAIGAPLGPAGAAAGGLVGGLAGSAVGATGGKLGGYHLYGAPEDAGGVSYEDQLDRAMEAGMTDLQINAGFSLLGATGRTAKRVISGTTAGAVTGFAGYRSPAIVDRVRAAREFGLRLTPADIHPRLTKIYSAVFGNVPAVVGPLKLGQSRRAEEVGKILRGLVGPLESGVNEIALGKNFLKSATNAVKVRKDWYQRIYGKVDGYFEANPQLRLDNNSLDAARKYLYDQSKRARPTVGVTSSTRRATTTTQSDTATNSLRARYEGYDWRVGESGQLEREALEPRAREQAVRSGVIQERQTQIQRVTEDHYTVGGFRNPANVDQFISDLAGSPDKLTYHQFKGLKADINAAMEVANENQARYLVQMMDGLDVASDTIADPAARQLLRRARNTYRQVMEFFENPTAATFVKADPKFASNVSALHKGKGSIASLMSSELFEATFKDLTPEGVQNISKLVGPDNMKAATERWVAETFERHLKTKADGPTTIDWNALRREFGLHAPTSKAYASTTAMLKSGRYSMDIDGLNRLVGVLEREVGPVVPDLSKMYVRAASIGGPKAAIRGLLATKALGAGGHPVGTAIATVLALRKFSNFLADPDRLAVVQAALDPVIKSPSAKAQLGRQIVRYLATDLARDNKGGETPSAGEIALEETKLNNIMDEADMSREQISQPISPFQLGYR